MKIAPRSFLFRTFPIPRALKTQLPFYTLTLLAASPWSAAQDRAPVEPKSLPAPDQPVAAVQPAIEKIDSNRFRIGLVTFNHQTREIRFPAKVNMTEGLLEFLVVHQNGKIHESLLVTDISPTQLNLAFTLLRYAASPELYPLPSETGGASDRFPDVPEDIRKRSRIAIDLEWQEDGKTRRLSANDLIQHSVKTTSMPPGPWVYGGSDVQDGKFAAEVTGDIIGIFVSQAAMVNYPGDDNRDDMVWLPFPKRVPAVDTEVTVIITPSFQNTPLPNP